MSNNCQCEGCNHVVENLKRQLGSGDYVQQLTAERDALKESLAEWKLDFRSVQADRDRLLQMLENRQRRMSVYREALESIIHAHQVGATCCRLDEIAQVALGETK